MRSRCACASEAPGRCAAEARDQHPRQQRRSDVRMARSVTGARAARRKRLLNRDERAAECAASDNNNFKPDREIVMTELSALWLPILLGAVFCFIASSIIHMAPLWHKNEYPQLPDEEKARAAIGALNVPPGDYMLPRCKTMKEMGSEEFKAEAAPGPEVDHHRAADRATAAWPRAWCYWFLFQLLVLRVRGVRVEPRARARRALPRRVPLRRRHGVHGVRARRRCRSPSGTSARGAPRSS